MIRSGFIKSTGKFRLRVVWYHKRDGFIANDSLTVSLEKMREFKRRR